MAASAGSASAGAAVGRRENIVARQIKRNGNELVDFIVNWAPKKIK